jgi:hypothetical protein
MEEVVFPACVKKLLTVNIVHVRSTVPGGGVPVCVHCSRGSCIPREVVYMYESYTLYKTQLSTFFFECVQVQAQYSTGSTTGSSTKI